MSLITRIVALGHNPTLSKHERLVHGAIEAIEMGELELGDKLPSINTMVREIGYARKTIVRAYEDLKDRGLIESKKVQGYYVISLETNSTLRVALLLFAFQSFQEEFYNTFRKELGAGYQIDVFFHHNNISVFETIMSNVQGKYGMYVVAPIQNPVIHPLLQRIAPDKLLIVDRYLPLGDEYSFISQEFEEANYSKLVELLSKIRTFRRFILFYNEDTDYVPIGIIRAFKRFISEYDIAGFVEKKYVPDSIKNGELYFILSDSILWQVIRDCVNKEFSIGKDIGILSHDDSLVKEIALGGITTISSDFKDMAKRAANHIKNKTQTKTIMPFRLIRRNSL